jgi:hypothetical protein
MNKLSFALTSVLLSVFLLAGCTSNGVNTKSTGDNRAKNNGFFRPLETTAPGSMPTNFTDVPSGEWYTDNVQWGSNLGIINGYPDLTFHPNSPITRAEVIKIIKSLADNGYITVPASPTPTPISPTPTPTTSPTTTSTSPTPS